MGILWFALFLCIFLSAFFSATETAFSASNRVRLKTVEGRKKERAQMALKLLEKYDSLLTAVLIGNNAVNIAGTAIATVLFTSYLMKGQPDGAAATAASAARHPASPPPITSTSTTISSPTTCR